MNRDGVVRELVFKSWWSEDKEEPSLGNNMIAGGGLKKRYITIKFDIYAQTFEIHLDNEEAVSLFNLMSVTAKNGLPIQCWDLHVGAKLNMLGKTTTLMQVSVFPTKVLGRSFIQLSKNAFIGRSED